MASKLQRVAEIVLGEVLVQLESLSDEANEIVGDDEALRAASGGPTRIADGCC